MALTTIKYNSVNPFSGIAPTPLFARSTTMVQFGTRWGQKHDISLRGNITGKCLTYPEYIDKKNRLLTGFNKDFQTFEVYDDSSLVLSYDFVKINGIDFDDSTWANGLIPFTIGLEAYPSGYFSGAFGILDPKEEVAFQENQDGRIKLTHTTAARGFCTSAGTNNALTNAQSWVATRTGWSSQILPAFITGISNGVCLQSIAENYDRLNGTYGVTETYLGDVFGDVTHGVLRYATDFSSGIADGVSEMSVEGELKGCRYQDLNELRNRYLGFNAFNEALNQYRRITNQTNLNFIPVSKGVSEDVNNKIISFSYKYSNDLRPQVNIVYNIEFTYDYEADVVSANISATVSSKAAYSATKWASVLAVANSLNLYSLVVGPYNDYVATVAPHLASFPLNKIPKSSSRSDNEFATTVSLSASFTNEPNAPNGLDVFSSSIAISPALHKYAASPILDGAGQYYIFDLGYVSRGTIEVNVQGVGSENSTSPQTLAILKTQAQNLALDNFAGAKMFLDSQNYSTGNASFGKAASVGATFSAESVEFIL